MPALECVRRIVSRYDNDYQYVGRTVTAEHVWSIERRRFENRRWVTRFFCVYCLSRKEMGDG